MEGGRGQGQSGTRSTKRAAASPTKRKRKKEEQEGNGKDAPVLKGTYTNMDEAISALISLTTSSSSSSLLASPAEVASLCHDITVMLTQGTPKPLKDEQISLIVDSLLKLLTSKEDTIATPHQCKALAAVVAYAGGGIGEDEASKTLRGLLRVLPSHPADVLAALTDVFRGLPHHFPSLLTDLVRHFSAGSSSVHLGAALQAVVYSATPSPDYCSNPDFHDATASQRVTEAVSMVVDTLLQCTLSDEGESTKVLGKVVDEWLVLMQHPRNSASDALLMQLMALLVQNYLRNENAPDKHIAIAAELVAKAAKRTKLLCEHMKEVAMPPVPPNWYRHPTELPSGDKMKELLAKSEPIENLKLPDLRRLASQLLMPSVPRVKEKLVAAIRDYVENSQLEQMTRAELQDLGRELGLKAVSSLKKDELRQRVQQAQMAISPEDMQKMAIDMEPPGVEGAYAVCLEALAPHLGARQYFLLQWMRDFQALAERKIANEKNATLARRLSFSKEDRVRWLLEQLSEEPEKKAGDLEPVISSQSPTQATVSDAHLIVLAARSKSLLSAYRTLVGHLVALFCSESVAGVVQKKLVVYLTDLMDVDPRIVEAIWPTVANTLKDTSISPSSLEASLEVLRLIMDRLDKYDAYVGGNKGGGQTRVEDMVYKMLHLVLSLTESRSPLVAKKAIKALQPILQSPPMSETTRLRVMAQLLGNFSTILPATQTEVAALILSVLPVPLPGDCTAIPTEKLVTERIAALVKLEIGDAPLLQFPIGNPHRPSNCIEAFRTLFKALGTEKEGSGKRSSKAAKSTSPCSVGKITANLFAVVSGRESGGAVTKGLSACCLHLIHRTCGATEGIDPTSLWGLVKAPAADDTEDELTFYYHLCKLMELTGCLRSLPKGKEGDPALQPLVDTMKGYVGRHSQRIVTAAMDCLASACIGAKGSPHLAHLKVVCTQMCKSYKSLSSFYLPALKAQPADKHPFIVPYILRGLYLMSQFLHSIDWTKSQIHDAVLGMDFDAETAAVVKDVFRGTGILDSVYKILSELMLVKLDDPLKDKVVAVLLKVVSALLLRNSATYLNASKELVYVALHRPQVELKASALELLRDFLVDEEERIERAQKRSSSQNSDSDKQEDSGLASTLMRHFLTSILDCLMSDNSSIRYLAMDVVQVCYHQGLSIPVLAVEHLIAIAVDEGQLGHHASALLTTFSSKFGDAIVAKAGPGVSLSYKYLHQSLKVPLSEVKGFAKGPAEFPRSIHSYLYGCTQSVKRSRETIPLQLVRLLSSPDRVKEWCSRIGHHEAALHFPRFVVESLATLPFSYETELHGVLQAVDQGLGLLAEDCEERLKALIPRNVSKKLRGTTKVEASLDVSVPSVAFALGLVCLCELKSFIKKAYNLTTRKLEAMTAAGKRKDDGTRRKVDIYDPSVFAVFCENTDVVDVVCDVEDGKVSFTYEHISDLKDTLSSAIMAEAAELWLASHKEQDEKSTKAAPKAKAEAPRPKASRRRRASSSSSSSSSSPAAPTATRQKAARR